MKKFICTILALSLLIGILPYGVFATTEAKSAETIQLEDGHYIVVSVTTSPARAGNTVNGSKTYICYDSDDNAEWKAELSASYVFTGGSYTCTSADCDVTVYASYRWHMISKSTNFAGNRATANLTMGKRVAGVTTDRPQYTINLYCDFYGNLS